MTTSSAQSASPRSPGEIEAEIERTRVRLASTVDEIADRVKPANVLHRALESIKAKFLDEDGNPRPERVAAAVVVVAAVAGLVLWRRSR